MARVTWRKRPDISKSKSIRKSKKYDIENQDRFNEIMNMTAKGSTTVFAQAAYRILYKHTKELIYDDYEPKRYKRTYQLLNSIVGPGKDFGGGKTLGSNGNFSAEVKFDKDRMQLQRWKSTAIWGAHTDYDHYSKRNKDARLELIDRFENQHFKRYAGGYTTEHPYNPKPAIYEREPVGMIKRTENDMNNAINSMRAEIDGQEDIVKVLNNILNVNVKI